ncbi:Uncharacterized protein QTN25_005684 [Entamoeba marina]
MSTIHLTYQNTCNEVHYFNAPFCKFISANHSVVLAFTFLFSIFLSLLSPFLLCCFTLIVSVYLLFRKHLKHVQFLFSVEEKEEYQGILRCTQEIKRRIVIFSHFDGNSFYNVIDKKMGNLIKVLIITLTVFQFMIFGVSYYYKDYVAFNIIFFLYLIATCGIFYFVVKYSSLSKQSISPIIISTLLKHLNGVQLEHTEVEFYTCNYYYYNHFTPFIEFHKNESLNQYVIVIEEIGNIVTLLNSIDSKMTNKEINDILLDSAEAEGFNFHLESQHSPSKELIEKGYKVSVISKGKEIDNKQIPDGQIEKVATILQRSLLQIDSYAEL